MAGVKCSAAIPFELVAGEQMLLMQCSIEWGDPYTHRVGWEVVVVVGTLYFLPMQ